jgi:Uncharacterised nucleotidyltransferase
VDGFLIKMFEMLRQQDVYYCLLRDCDASTSLPEVDLLVARRHLNSLSSVLEAQGFLTLPSWGHAPHRFYVGFDSTRGRQVKLDVVWTLRYGKPIRSLKVDLAERCLANRRYDNGVYVLSPEHEFLTLLLHGLLDRGTLEPRHSRRLMELRETPECRLDDTGRLGPLVREFLTPAISTDMLAETMATGDWISLSARRGALRWQLFLRAPLASAKWELSARFLRGIRPLLRAFHSPGAASLASNRGSPEDSRAAGLTVGASEAQQGVAWVRKLKN